MIYNLDIMHCDVLEVQFKKESEQRSSRSGWVTKACFLVWTLMCKAKRLISVDIPPHMVGRVGKMNSWMTELSRRYCCRYIKPWSVFESVAWVGGGGEDG